MNWYYANNGQRQGPIAQVELERLVSTSVITDQTLVWKEGMAEWKPYADVKTSLPPAFTTASEAGAFTAGAANTGEETAICAVSGKAFPKREMIQYEGKWVSAQHRDEFFQRIRQGLAPVDSDSVPGPYGYGGFWRRFCAKFVDGIISGVVIVPIMFLLAVVMLGSWNFIQPEQLSNVSSGQLMLFNFVTSLIGLAFNLAYSVFFIRKYDATPGKILMGLKLVRSDGASLTTGRIVGRCLAEGSGNLFSGIGMQFVSIIVLIGYVIAAFDSEKRTVFDRLCDTRVIKTRQ
jgi:uncharacterized RDD family membrane protein YckC